MISPVILSSMHLKLHSVQKNEILNLNNESQGYGLVLSKEDVDEIINSRNDTLKYYGRIELDIDVTKKIIENLYTSQYTEKDDYVELINDMQEIFYYLKNETLDEISDIEIITILDKFYNGYSGRIDNVQEEAERFAKEFKFIGGE
ncbi:hypothetical protein EAI30_07190 [Romboutsia ilealis]|uniref:Uncharacterized protein n=1 Tax=Romboutsia faecis TaxID=2764597 RepID=A0ABR7JKA9_9FIRM|nr:DUF6323 family protein [Romboutsia faecis]MBC5995358.1 hypothetical protein [Romboutsia faecis]MRN24397.1 hypothetical protein [Romboutsia ilealis]